MFGFAECRMGVNLGANRERRLALGCPSSKFHISAFRWTPPFFRFRFFFVDWPPCLIWPPGRTSLWPVRLYAAGAGPPGALPPLRAESVEGLGSLLDGLRASGPGDHLKGYQDEVG